MVALELLGASVGVDETVSQFVNYLAQPIPIGQQHAVVAVEPAVTDAEREGDPGEHERGCRESEGSADHGCRTDSRTSYSLGATHTSSSTHRSQIRTNGRPRAVWSAPGTVSVNSPGLAT